ncbi:MAG: hypothetical protein ACRC28_11090 [Clostridium sp.]|uniref:hypothetical protein n=1 Tax=Clostridium sp. TaxID=1506 RepID=UPI003F318BC8
MEDLNRVSTEDVSVYLCPNCGGGMKFDIGEQKFTCEYCGTEEVFEKVDNNVNEYDLYEFMDSERSNTWQSETKVLECTGCGAEIIINNEETAKFCSFCGSSHITKGHEEALIKPEGILPFKINDAKAKELLEKWIKTRYLAPNDLKNMYSSEKLMAIYVPYWTFDANAHGVYQGEGGKRAYKNVTVNGKTTRKEITIWYSVNGSIDHNFDDIQVNASKNFREDIIDGVEPFSMDKLVPYDKKYLSGYVAERYTKNLKTCFEIAKKEMREKLKSQAKSQIKLRYDEAKVTRIKVKYKDSKFKHILVPVWTANYDYKGKKYKYIINGETGKMSGQIPYSGAKLALIAVGILILVGLYVYGGM